MNQQSDIADILGAMANGPIVGGGHTGRVGEVLRHFSRAAIPLTTCADGRHLGLKVSTLKRYACRLSLKFPDYCPRHMKPKKAKVKRHG